MVRKGPSGSGMPIRTLLLLFIVLVQTGRSQNPGQAQGQGNNIQGPHKRFEYKYSFKPPYLAQKDGNVPFFEYQGNALASGEGVRITPSLRSQKGQIWGKLAATFDWWEVEIHFRVKGKRIGADGLAFWYTATRGFEGPVFGSSDRWVGLGIFFDSFDNDNQQNNPYISAMTNDGHQQYDHQKDGSSQQLGGCLRDFRNKPFPVRAKIVYYQNSLTIYIHNGMSNNERDFELCMKVENVVLPKNGYFGMSAATGGLADDHDVMKFLVSSLRQPGDASQQAAPSASVDAETKKLDQEFEDYQKKLKEQKDQWVKEHPDEAKKLEDDFSDDDFFGEDEKNFQQIFQSQDVVRGMLTELDKKMDTLIAKQDYAQQSIGILSRGGAIPQQQQQQQQQPPTQQGDQFAGSSIRRDEVNAILANQREVVTAIRDIKSVMYDIQSKTGQILSKPSGSAQPVGGAYDVQNSIREMRDSLNSARHEFQTATQRMGSQPAGGCDLSKVSCVSTSILIAAILVQLVLLISYLMYRDSKEQQAKKFY